MNLSTGALLDATFHAFIEEAVRDARINPRQLGFEIRETQCRRHPAEVVRASLQMCERVGCHVIIDDFTFHSEVLQLLRQRAVRMLKIDASLTVKSLQDKMAQAQIAAISHASRMLGMHCVVKRIESPLVRQWLAATGVDLRAGLPAGRPAADHRTRLAATDRAGHAALKRRPCLPAAVAPCPLSRRPVRPAASNYQL